MHIECAIKLVQEISLETFGQKIKESTVLIFTPLLLLVPICDMDVLRSAIKESLIQYWGTNDTDYEVVG